MPTKSLSHPVTGLNRWWPLPFVWGELSIALTAALFAACAAPCPNGVYEGVLLVEDDEYFGSDSLGGSFSYGGLDNSGIQACREIQGSLIFGGDVSSFSDFDGLEYVSGSIQFQESGYPRREIDGRRWEVMDGMNALREVGGGIVGGPLLLGMNSLEVAGGIRIPSAGFFSLETVAGDLLGAGSLGLGHLARLETVGGNFGTAAGDISSLVSLTTVGGAFDVEFADEVDFSLPELEAIGGDLDVIQNTRIETWQTPSLLRIGGHAFVYWNGISVADTTTTVRAALNEVDIGGTTLVCENGGRQDPCPWSAECLEYEDSAYCCGDAACGGHDVCWEDAASCQGG